jgi:hypothetical protein
VPYRAARDQYEAAENFAALLDARCPSLETRRRSFEFFEKQNARRVAPSRG